MTNRAEILGSILLLAAAAGLEHIAPPETPPPSSSRVPTAAEIREAKAILRVPAMTSTGIDEQERARELLRRAGVPEAEIPEPEIPGYPDELLDEEPPGAEAESQGLGPGAMMIRVAPPAPEPPPARSAAAGAPDQATLLAHLHQRVTVAYVGQWNSGGDKDANEHPSSLPDDWLQRRTGYLSHVDAQVIGLAGMRWESSGGPKYMDVRYVPRATLAEFQALEPREGTAPLADFNADGTVNVSDLLAYLGAFRAAGGEPPEGLQLPE